MNDVEPTVEPVDLYDAEYWSNCDSGRGAAPSLLWTDLAFILHHCLGHDHRTGEDLAGGLRAVDVGCGPGFLVQALQARGIWTVGLDISPYALSIAPEDIRDHLRLWDVGFIDDSFYGREVFDIALCTEVLEHVERDIADRAVRNIWNLLKPGGIAVLTICVTGREENDPTHVNVTDRRFWDRLFADQGFFEDKEMEAELRRFHILESHNGLFVLRKPR